MGSFSIGLSGLNAAQRAIELIGTNIANATSEGYHRQELVLRPAALNVRDNVSLGGVKVCGTRRDVDTLLEMELSRQQSSLGQAAEELDMLQMVESALGQLDDTGLAGALGKFFDALTELSADPSSLPLREQAVWAGDALAGQLRNVGQFVDDLKARVRLRAEQHIQQANTLLEQIADLNAEIPSVALRGGTPNLLQDSRDRAVRELADLAAVRTWGQTDAADAISVTVWGRPAATGSAAVEMQVTVTEDEALAVAFGHSAVTQTALDGGRIGAALSLYNDLVAGVGDRLDAIAGELVTAVNRLHVQGVGMDGSFQDLTGRWVADGLLGDVLEGVTAGSFHVRVTDTAAGHSTRHEIAVDPAADELADVRDRLDAVDGLSASLVGSALRIQADAGYTFDFTPALLERPDTAGITGDAVPTVSGLYTAAANETFTCQVAGTGTVGVDDNLALQVRNAAAELVKEINLGAGYADGDAVDVVDGIRLAFGAGQLNDGDAFTIQALADTDASGLLAAAGLNTFFSGTRARDVAVRQDLLDHPRNLAGALGAGQTDGQNVLRMAAVAEAPRAAMDNATPQEAFHRLVTEVGQDVVVRRARKGNVQDIIQQLGIQQDEISGVDLNEEAAQLIVFERMFQAASKALAVQMQALEYLFSAV
jgi:flagellar hook-associated protein FlgK